MIGRNIELRALSNESWEPPGEISTEPQRGGIVGRGVLVVAALTGVFAVLAAQYGDFIRAANPLSLPRMPGFGDADTVMSGVSGDGAEQQGLRIGESGELTADLERKRQLVRELVLVYQKAFAGPPWFEVSKCPTCPSGFSAQEIGTNCLKCGSYLTTEAYPANELYQSLLARTTSPESTVYAERLPDGRPVLGAILRPLSEDQIVERYRGRVDEAWLRSILPDKVLWLDEIFADLDARQSGNLQNLKEVIERSAENAGTDTVAFRTINERLLGKIQSLYGNRVQVISVPDTAGAGTSYLVTIKLP